MAMGWVYPTYASHENGMRDFPQKVAERYARAFRVSPEFILFGTNAPEWYKEAGGKEELVEVPSTPTRSLRAFDHDESLNLKEWLNGKHGGPGPQFFISDLGNLSPKSFALKVKVDEMRVKPSVPDEKEILPGDIAIVDAERNDVRPGDVAAVILEDDSLIHLRKVVMRGNKPIFMALNRDHGEFEDGDVIGRVMWVISAM